MLLENVYKILNLTVTLYFYYIPNAIGTVSSLFKTARDFILEKKKKGNQTQRKRDQICRSYWAVDCKEVEVEEGGQKVQTSSYKMRTRGCDAQHDDVINAALWYTREVVKRVNKP